LPTKRNLIAAKERKDLRIIPASVGIPSFILDIAQLLWLENVTARNVDAVIRDAKDHPAFVVTDKVIGDDAFDGVVQKCCVFSVEETRPETQDIVDIVLAETAMSGSRALIVVVVFMIIGSRWREVQEETEQGENILHVE
jgi:hypothetical protein